MINKGLLTSKTEERSTPQNFFDVLNKYYKFTLDPCSTDENAKCKKHFTKKENWLQKDRNNNIVFMNPPYWKTIKYRVEKATSVNENTTCVCLLPTRTDTKRFQEYLYKNPKVKIYFIKWRLKFWGSKNSAPFPSMLAIINDLFYKWNNEKFIFDNEI